MMLHRSLLRSSAAVATLALFCVAAPAAAQTDEVLGIATRLEAAQAEYGADDPLAIVFTLTNTTDGALNVLKWHTPLEGFKADMFAVTRDGEPVVYEGRVYKRGAPDPGDYVALAAGESVSETLDLADAYAIYEEGDYSVTYRSRFFDVGSEAPEALAAKAMFQAKDVSSNAITFKLLESKEPPAPPVEEPAPAPAAEDVEAQKVPPVFKNCSSSQKTSINTAHSEAETMAAASALVLGGTPTDKRSGCTRYTTWFGSYTASRWSTVETHFEDILDAIANETLTFNCDCNDSAYAYVYPNQPYKIWLCNAFWSAPTTGTDSKAGTIIHEVSHFNVVAGTDDHAYGHANCKALANSNPSNAVQNADSHEYFAENTPALDCGLEHVVGAIGIVLLLVLADGAARRRRVVE